MAGMHRLIAPLSLVMLLLVAMSTAPGAEAKRPRPNPSPTATPTATPALAPTATPVSWLEGIDVSHYQGSIDWAKVAAAGKRFAFIRASAGSLTADSRYTQNRTGARAAGVAVGAYHFANPDGATNDALNEANWFLSNATPASGDILPALDLEVSNGLSVSALTTWTQTWLGRVTAVTGVRPIIYTTPSFWRTNMGDTDWFARNGYRILWIAHWTSAAQPTVPASNWGGNSWTFWQYSSTGSVPGISGAVDLDRYNGSSLPASVFNP
jgi:lysozyme